MPRRCKVATQESSETLLTSAVVLHVKIGAAFLPSSTASDRTAAAVTHVPAGLSAYCPAGASGRLSFGVGAAPQQQPDNSVSCGFRLISPSGGSMFSLENLQLRPARLSSGRVLTAAAATAKAPAGPDGSVLYALEWTAVEAVSAGAARQQWLPLDVNTAGAWQLAIAGGGSRSRGLARRPDAADPAGAAISQLRHLQAALQGPHAAGLAESISLHSRGLPDGATRSPAAYRTSAAAGRALLRVAAQEKPGVRFTAVGADELGCALQRAPMVPPAADAFGIASSAGVWLAPRLAAAHAQMQSSASTPLATNSSLLAAASGAGTILVTGGLGDIGLLVGMWAAQNSGARVWLLGRNPRSGSLAAAIQLGGAVVNTAQCEVSSRGDVVALVRMLAAAGEPPVTGIIHAGGVIKVRTMLCSSVVEYCLVQLQKLASCFYGRMTCHDERHPSLLQSMCNVKLAVYLCLPACTSDGCHCSLPACSGGMVISKPCFRNRQELQRI